MVIPVGVTSDSPLSFPSEEFNRNFEDAAARGYYAEHDFKVSGPIPGQDCCQGRCAFGQSLYWCLPARLRKRQGQGVLYLSW